MTSRSLLHRRVAMAATGLLFVAAVAACTTTNADAPVPTAADPTTAAPSTTVPISTTTSSTTSTSTTSSTTTTTTPPPPTVNTAVLADVVAAASLGPVPEGVRVGAATGDRAAVYNDGCHVTWNEIVPKKDCFYGDTSSDVLVVVTGDSEAAHWFGAFDEAGKANHWKIVMVTKQGCPTADVSVYSAADKTKRNVRYPACDEWRGNALAYIASLQPRLVVFPMLSRRSIVGIPKAAALPYWAKGLGRSIDAVKAEGTDVLVLGDTPKTSGNVPACVASRRGDVSPCGNSRDAAVDPVRAQGLADAAALHGASFVDPSNWLCTDTFCPAVIGTSVVYRDELHLTDQFARTRAPQVAEAIEFALAGPQP
jgi:hypothetical protein